MRMMWYDDSFRELWKREATVRHSEVSTGTSTATQLESWGAQCRGRSLASAEDRTGGLAVGSAWGKEVVPKGATRKHNEQEISSVAMRGGGGGSGGGGREGDRREVE